MIDIDTKIAELLKNSSFSSYDEVILFFKQIISLCDDNIQDIVKLTTIQENEKNTLIKTIRNEIYIWSLLCDIFTVYASKSTELDVDDISSLSDLKAVEYYLLHNDDYLYYQAIANWLETMYSHHDIPVKTIIPLNTKTSVKSLSSNVNKPFESTINLEDPEEKEEYDKEKDLLSLLWYHIRCGNIDQAIQVCSDYHDYWRITSLEGYFIPDYIKSADGGYDYTGNPHRSLWLNSCHLICKKEGGSIIEEMERCIYGYFSGDADIISQLSLIQSPYDFLWIYIRSNMHIQANEYYKQFQLISHNPLKEKSEEDMEIYGSIYTLSDIMKKLDNIQKESIIHAKEDLFFQISKLILLNDFDSLYSYLQTSLETISKRKCTDIEEEKLRFLFLLLFFMKEFINHYSIPSEENKNSKESEDDNKSTTICVNECRLLIGNHMNDTIYTNLLLNYIMLLGKHNKFESLHFYVSHLPDCMKLFILVSLFKQYTSQEDDESIYILSLYNTFPSLLLSVLHLYVMEQLTMNNITISQTSTYITTTDYEHFDIFIKEHPDYMKYTSDNCINILKSITIFEDVKDVNKPIEENYFESKLSFLKLFSIHPSLYCYGLMIYQIILIQAFKYNYKFGNEVLHYIETIDNSLYIMDNILEILDTENHTYNSIYSNIITINFSELKNFYSMIHIYSELINQTYEVLDQSTTILDMKQTISDDIINKDIYDTIEANTSVISVLTFNYISFLKTHSLYIYTCDTYIQELISEPIVESIIYHFYILYDEVINIQQDQEKKKVLYQECLTNSLFITQDSKLYTLLSQECLKYILSKITEAHIQLSL